MIGPRLAAAAHDGGREADAVVLAQRRHAACCRARWHRPPPRPTRSTGRGRRSIVTCAEAAAHAADDGVGEVDQPLHDAGLDHQLAGQDEERDRHQRERVDRVHHAGGSRLKSTSLTMRPATAPNAERERERHAEQRDAEEHEHDEEAHSASCLIPVATADRRRGHGPSSAIHSEVQRAECAPADRPTRHDEPARRWPRPTPSSRPTGRCAMRADSQATSSMSARRRSAPSARASAPRSARGKRATTISMPICDAGADAERDRKEDRPDESQARRSRRPSRASCSSRSAARPAPTRRRPSRAISAHDDPAGGGVERRQRERQRPQRAAGPRHRRPASDGAVVHRRPPPAQPPAFLTSRQHAGRRASAPTRFLMSSTTPAVALRIASRSAGRHLGRTACPSSAARPAPSASALAAAARCAATALAHRGLIDLAGAPAAAPRTSSCWPPPR